MFPGTYTALVCSNLHRCTSHILIRRITAKIRKVYRGYLKSLVLVFVSHGIYFQPKSGRTATNSMKIMKELPQKYKGNIAISDFWVLCKILFLENDSTAFRSIRLIKTVLLIPILAYLVTFYVLWHMS